MLEAGRLPLGDLALLAQREGQSTRPIYRVHRWFARRLGSQFRAILAGISLEAEAVDEFWPRFHGQIPMDDCLVLDPFVGGGTTITEAARCGASVLGQDIDPVAAAIARFTLSAAAYEDVDVESQAGLREARESIQPFHRTVLADGREADVLHHFWVEVLRCGACGDELELHPHFRLAYQRDQGLQWTFCRSCHAIHELPLEDSECVCSCGARTEITKGPVRRGGVTCPGCDVRQRLSQGRDGSPPEWRLFAQEVLIDQGGLRPQRSFRAVEDADHEVFANAGKRLIQEESSEGIFAPRREIPSHGRWDQRPLIHGIHRYRDLFNSRQLLHLTLLGRAIGRVNDVRARELLELAFTEHLTTNCMYTGYAFGYRRTSPLFSIHGFRHVTRPVELNPWLEGIGRGTFPNAVAKIRRAVAYARKPSDLAVDGGRRPSRQSLVAVGTAADDWSCVFSGDSRAAVSVGDSSSLYPIPDESVDLVLTDPPYYDNVSYSELSDFYLAWRQALGAEAGPYSDPTRAAPIVQNLAFTRDGEAGERAYEERLAAALKECRRVLRPAGLCVFTYHHSAAAAWLRLGRALAASGLECTAVVPMRGEGQGGLHTHPGTIKWDAVMVCRRGVGAVEIAEPTIGHDAIIEAQQQAQIQAERLASHGCGGLAEPDRLNLLRAWLVARSTSSRAPSSSCSLESALGAARS